MKIKLFGYSVLLTLFLSACASDPRNEKQMAFNDALNFEKAAAKKLAESERAVSSLTDAEIKNQLEAALNDVTAIIKQTGHGIYVEYTAADNVLYMWYPNNYVLVIGSWGISDDFSPPRACFKYSGAHHGVTGEYEPNECVSPAQTLSEAYVIDKRAGDAFGLRTTGIPYSKSSGNLPPWPEEWEQYKK